MATPGSTRPSRRRTSASQEKTQQAISASTLQPRADLSNEARYSMIQQAAYLRAELRGFQPGFELDDWIAAENEVDALLRSADGMAQQ